MKIIPIVVAAVTAVIGVGIEQVEAKTSTSVKETSLVVPNITQFIHTIFPIINTKLEYQPNQLFQPQISQQLQAPTSIKPETVLTSQATYLNAREMFTGIWVGQLYECPSGTYHTETVKIVVREDFLIATKITGDDCVPQDSQTFSGRIPKRISPGKSFGVTWTLGSPQNPASATGGGKITVVNANTFIASGGDSVMLFTKQRTSY